MRHFFGFVFGLLLGPVILLASGWLLPRVGALADSDRGFLGVGELATLSALSALALLVALLLVPPRLTPLVPGMAGVGIAAATAAYLVRPTLVDLLPVSVVPGLGGMRDIVRAGLEGATTLLEVGLLVPLAVALLVPLLFPSRWRSYRPRGAHALSDDDDDDDDADGFTDDLIDHDRAA